MITFLKSYNMTVFSKFRCSKLNNSIIFINQSVHCELRDISCMLYISVQSYCLQLLAI